MTVRENAIPIPISLDEYTRLINDAPLNTVVAVKFGPGRVRLEVSEANEWALNKLAELRGVT